MAKSKSTARKVDDAYKALLRLREKHGFGKPLLAEEIHDGFVRRYELDWKVIQEIRNHLHTYNQHLGPMRWPEDKGG